jgi:hypothetical protein
MGKMEKLEIKEIRWVVEKENGEEGERLIRIELVKRGENDKRWMVVEIKKRRKEEEKREKREKSNKW